MHGAAGVFETIAAVNGTPRLLARHLRRLADGCGRLGLQAPREAELVAEIAMQAALPGTGVVKVIVTDSGNGDAGPAQYSVRAEPPRLRPPHWASDGVAVITCSTRFSFAPALAGVKLIVRSAQTAARREWSGDAIAEGLMLDPEGRLISGTMTNVYAVLDGLICTPAITRCGVAGVMRAALLEAWQESGRAVAVRDLDPAELRDATEIFLSNALIGIWPVHSVDGHATNIGPVARAAASWVQRIVKEAPPSQSAAGAPRFPPS